MKIDRELEIDFIRVSQKEISEITRFDEGKIKKRNHFIESQFEWTQEIREKLTLVNEKLILEEKRVFLAHRQLEKVCKLMVKNKTIDDFNIDIELSFYNKKHYKKYEPSIYGNPFFKSTDDFMLFQKHEAEYNAEPHNEHRINAPLPEINHCYSFHSLYDHSHLTWFDIYNIDEVWMEIKIDYQFFSKVKNKV
jgi:hypothetical protein